MSVESDIGAGLGSRLGQLDLLTPLPESPLTGIGLSGGDQTPHSPMVEDLSRLLSKTESDVRRADARTEMLPEIEGYELLDKLGSGGMGSVWRARQLSTRRVVALKLLNHACFDSPKGRARFAREVEVAAKLEHPNIARVYDSGLHKGFYYYAMELIEGERLDKFIHSRRMTGGEALEIFGAICEALQYAHGLGIVHRDLKPSNIMVTAGGKPMVLDFGLAKALHSPESGANVSVEGDVVGTPMYMAPEQAAGRHELVGACSDIYSLGVILYEMLTGERPFRGSYQMVLYQVVHDEPQPPRALNENIARDLEAVVLKAMQKESRRRYESVTSLAEDLRNYRAGKSVSARPAGWLERGWNWCLRRERIPAPGYYLAFLGLVFLLWNLLGAALVAMKFDIVSNERRAIALLLVQCVVMFVPMIWLGILTARGAVAAIWGGAVFNFIVTCMTVLQATGPTLSIFETSDEFHLPRPVFALFGILAAIAFLGYAVALLAYYSNRNAIALSKGWRRGC